MRFIERKDIDTAKWNARIAADDKENVFSYAWYLDAVAENWGALVSDNSYETILPISFTQKLGVKRLYQAPFTREYVIFGTNFSWKDAIPILTRQFKELSFRNWQNDILTKVDNRIHQILPFTEELETEYRSNAKRLIKKGIKNFRFEAFDDPPFLIQLFQTTVGHKIDTINANDLQVLTELMMQSKLEGKGEMIVARDSDDKIVAGGFFLKDKGRITYLKGAATEEAKKLGAMYALMDFAFQRYKNKFDLMDFGGSDIESVATFYKKFGAIDRIYYNYQIDNTPAWFKLLKKIKG